MGTLKIWNKKNCLKIFPNRFFLNQIKKERPLKKKLKILSVTFKTLMTTTNTWLDSKLISKTLALRLKNILPSLISPNQTAYVKNRFVSEGGRLISDIMDVSEHLNIEGFFRNNIIQKEFDSVNHSFLLAFIKVFWFWERFFTLDWNFPY